MIKEYEPRYAISVIWFYIMSYHIKISWYKFLLPRVQYFILMSGCFESIRDLHKRCFLNVVKLCLFVCLSHVCVVILFSSWTHAHKRKCKLLQILWYLSLHCISWWNFLQRWKDINSNVKCHYLDKYIRFYPISRKF